MEQYLVDQYGVVEDENWLTDANEIEDYFSDNFREHFDCGQGYYEDEADIICKIGDKFYNVHMTVEIESAKQDRGDRLYWAENLLSVTYEEIEKPKPKEEKVTITKSEYDSLLEDSEKLSCLEACGVDNWQGYEDAMEMFNEEDS